MQLVPQPPEFVFFFSSGRRHTRYWRDWSSDVCSSDLVLAELREADVVLAEDTRHTRGLLERHGIRARLLSYHEHNEAARVAELLPRLEAGERIAVVSDAGMPLVSDPGERLVRSALDLGVQVTVLPGPSAVETALVASGL